MHKISIIQACGVFWHQGRIKASAGPGAVPNAVPLQTYNQLTTPTKCWPPLMRHCWQCAIVPAGAQS